MPAPVRCPVTRRGASVQAALHFFKFMDAAADVLEQCGERRLVCLKAARHTLLQQLCKSFVVLHEEVALSKVKRDQSLHFFHVDVAQSRTARTSPAMSLADQAPAAQKPGGCQCRKEWIGGHAGNRTFHRTHSGCRSRIDAGQLTQFAMHA